MKKILNGIKKFYKQNKFEKAIIGLSGGIDSSVCAALLVKALGPDHVIGVYLPNNNMNDLADVEALCKHLKIDFVINNIAAPVIAISKNFSYRLSLANIASRVRMTYLYAYANENKGFVCGTTNYLEYQLGYFTKFGDGACDLEPIINLYKSDIYKLGKEFKLPQSILTKAPSAGLWPNQTDEDEMGVTYDEIEKYFKKQKISDKSRKIIQNFIKTSAHKRKLPFAI